MHELVSDTDLKVGCKDELLWIAPTALFYVGGLPVHVGMEAICQAHQAALMVLLRVQ